MNGDVASETTLSRGADRRADDRTTTLFQVARLLTERGAQHLCLIRNIGPGGMMLEIYAPLEAGMRVDAEIVDSVPLGVDTPEDLERARKLLTL